MKKCRRNFSASQGEKRRHNPYEERELKGALSEVGEAFQRSEAEKEQVSIHKSWVGEL